MCHWLFYILPSANVHLENYTKWPSLEYTGPDQQECYFSNRNTAGRQSLSIMIVLSCYKKKDFALFQSLKQFFRITGLTAPSTGPTQITHCQCGADYVLTRYSCDSFFCTIGSPKEVCDCVECRLSLSQAVCHFLTLQRN